MTLGLVTFVAVIAVDVVVLLGDLCLHLNGEATITSFVKADPVWGLPLVSWQLIGAAGLAAHLWL